MLPVSFLSRRLEDMASDGTARESAEEGVDRLASLLKRPFFSSAHDISDVEASQCQLQWVTWNSL